MDAAAGTTDDKSSDSTEFLCPRCNQPVTWDCKALCYDSCNNWLHKDCLGMSSKTYNDLEADGADVLWFCPRPSCVKPNFSYSPFNPPLVTSSSNIYSILSNASNDPSMKSEPCDPGSVHTPHVSSSSIKSEPCDQGSVHTPQVSRSLRTHSSSSITSIKTPSSVGEPQDTSTPNRLLKSPQNTKPRRYQRHRDNPNQRKLVLMNCQSICNKKTELETLLMSVEPDIVIATESWLKPDIGSPEIFPPNYNVYRKDRIDKDGGGVFILVADRLISCALDEFASDHEAVWVQIKEDKGPNLNVGAY